MIQSVPSLSAEKTNSCPPWVIVGVDSAVDISMTWEGNSSIMQSVDAIVN